MSIAGKTDTGKKRGMNEDSFHAEKINNIHLAVVCDGVGGAKAGEVASSIGVKSFVETFKELLASSYLKEKEKEKEKEKKDSAQSKDSKNTKVSKNIKNTKNPQNPPNSQINTGDISESNNIDYKDILIASVAKANEDIFSASKENKETRGMGTTMVACIFDKDANEYFAVNVGDSRLYIIDEKKHKLTQITKDHSLVQDLVDSGALTKEQAEKSPNKNIITRVLGIDDVVDVDFYRDKYESGIFLLCSDGLCDYVAEEDIVKFVSQWAQYGSDEDTADAEDNENNKNNENSENIKNNENKNGGENENIDNIENCLSSLISKANENGGGDNITAVIIKP